MKLKFLGIAALMISICGTVSAQSSKVLNNAVDTSKIMSDEAKTIFKVFNNTVNYDDNFDFVYWDKNGFTAKVVGGTSDGEIVSFHVYKTDDDSYFVANGAFKFYNYENGKLTPIEYSLPSLKKGRDFVPYFRDNGFFFCDYNPQTKETKEDWYYWNGYDFVAEKSIGDTVSALSTKVLDNAVDTSKYMSDEAKTIYKTFNNPEYEYYGEKFDFVYWDKNGFTAKVVGGNDDGTKVSFHIFKTVDGNFYVVNEAAKNTFWYYENGKLRSTKDFPVQYTNLHYGHPLYAYFRDEGFFYSDYNPSTKSSKEEWYYWNGKQFVSESSLNYIVNTSKVLSEDAKKIFAYVDYNDYSYGRDCACNKKTPEWDKNGFSIVIDFDCKDGWDSNHIWRVNYRIYKLKDKYLVALYGLGAKFWYFENGKLTEAKNILPKAATGKNDYWEYSFSDNKIVRTNKNANVSETFVLDGEKFVKKE